MHYRKYKISEWNGFAISPEVTRTIVRECLKGMHDDPELPCKYVVTGDLLVLATRDASDTFDYVDVWIARIEDHGTPLEDDDLSIIEV